MPNIPQRKTTITTTNFLYCSYGKGHDQKGIKRTITGHIGRRIGTVARDIGGVATSGTNKGGYRTVAVCRAETETRTGKGQQPDGLGLADVLKVNHFNKN